MRLRLSLAAVALIALALGLAGAGLVVIFDRVLDARTADEQDLVVKYLAGQISREPDGTLKLGMEPADPRYATPYGGLYWQISSDRSDLRSRSLWDKRLDLSDSAFEARTIQDLEGPDGGRLIAVIRTVAIGGQSSNTQLIIAAGMDRKNLEASRATYLNLLIPSLIMLGLVLALAMLLFVTRALGPFRLLRNELRAIHEGHRRTLPQHFPDEVLPLVEDLNRLIGVQERALQRARTQAGDMAHGLKTPLAVLTALARRNADAQPGLTAEIEEQALAMSRQVERTLARARIAAGRDLRRHTCLVEPVVRKVVATLRRLPEADSLAWEISLPTNLTFPGDEGDLTELLGNLLDNARKWAHRRVAVSATTDMSIQNGATVILKIEDDGPGMSDASIAQIGRGTRLDETKSGTGFGIAIAGDIAAETGTRITLSLARLGGLKVEIAWPLLAKR